MANNMHKNDNDEGTCTSSRSTYTKKYNNAFFTTTIQQKKG